MYAGQTGKEKGRGNIIDYLNWRGDIPMDQVPLGEIDGLILAYLAYMPFEGLVPSQAVGERTLLRDTASELVRRNLDEGIRLAYCVGNSDEQDRELLAMLAKSERFGGLELCGFADYYDREGQEQFSAVTFLLPGERAFLAFRGTDSTVVGWKENFNMTFDEEVPAQRDAVIYTESIAHALGMPLILGGHSKGGNLAVYAGMFCAEDVRESILAAYNYDGPGFNEKVASSPEFSSMMGRVHTYLPQSSLVGILMWHREPFTIIESNSVSIFQHVVYTWQLMGGQFIKLEERTGSSRFADETLKAWLKELPPRQRESFINGVYSVIAAGEGKNLRDILDGRNLPAMLRAAGSLDEQTRQDVLDAIRSFGDALRESASSLLERRNISKTV